MAARRIATLELGTAPFVPHIAKAEGATRVSLMRRLPDGGHVSVWSHDCTPKEGKIVIAWMAGQPDRWSLWGRIVMRLGGETLSPIVIDGSREAEALRAEAEQERLEKVRVQQRLAREITLYFYDPKAGAPALGLQRGTQQKPFWKMRFIEKWERDRVMDWLRWQRERFDEFAEYHAEHGDLELERLVLAGMREGEREAKARKVTSAGRRPLRFWRGE